MNCTIKVLGTGCNKCISLFHNTQQAMEHLGIEAEIEMVTNVNDIISFGVAVTPALVIDDMVWTSGEVPSIEEIQVIFKKCGSLKADKL